MFRAQRFRSAGNGGQRGAPSTGSLNPAGGVDLTNRATRARVAATRWQQDARRRSVSDIPTRMAAQSGADVSALRGASNAGSRFGGERRPFSSRSIEETS